MSSERWLDEAAQRLKTQREQLQRDIDSHEAESQRRIAMMRRKLEALDATVQQLYTNTNAFKSATERKARRELRLSQQENEELKKELAVLKAQMENRQVEGPEADKAKTFAIFDSILFAISNWSDDGQTAPDIELASQSVLFPAVYERIMTGTDEAYILTKVPTAAAEVVRRGREFVQFFRQVCDASLMDATTWAEYARDIQTWWVNDALPLLYEARDQRWDEDEPFSLDEMIAWRDFPANRPLLYPAVFDGMELVQKYSTEIRETTGLPEFNKLVMSTRISSDV